MSLATRLLGCLTAGAIMAASGTASAWTRSYVVEWFEPAMYYGAANGLTEPGTDCPKGTNPSLDRRKALKTSYRTWAEIDKLLDPENSQWNKVGMIRGPNRENVYDKPWSIPDPKMTEVSGDTAYGFDLDGNSSNGFRSQDGRKGVDNNYYKAVGCWNGWRGPARLSHHAKYVNDGMRDGVFSVLMVASGAGPDPDNDPNAKLAIYFSKDKMVKDANGQIARDFSFRVNTDPRFQSVVPARTVKGAIESAGSVDVQMHDVETAPFFPPQLKLFKAQFRFEPTADGGMTGYMGGYRPVDDYYTGWAAAGTTHEAVTHIDIPAYWYAIHRNADYKTTPAAEKNDAISTAYRFFMLPAFVVTPDGKTPVKAAQPFAGEIDERLSIRLRPNFGRPEAASNVTATAPSSSKSR